MVFRHRLYLPGSRRRRPSPEEELGEHPRPSVGIRDDDAARPHRPLYRRILHYSRLGGESRIPEYLELFPGLQYIPDWYIRGMQTITVRVILSTCIIV